MSRRHRAEQRKIIPDAKYHNETVAKFMNYIMLDGKKSTSERIVYSAFDKVAADLKKDPIEAFQEAIDNVRPHLEVRSRRVGGATYQVPQEVRPRRALALSLRWIINAARARKERTMEARVANELIDAINKRGSAVKKREDTHKMAEANKAFAHFRW